MSPFEERRLDPSFSQVRRRHQSVVSPAHHNHVILLLELPSRHAGHMPDGGDAETFSAGPGQQGEKR